MTLLEAILRSNLEFEAETMSANDLAREGIAKMVIRQHNTILESGILGEIIDASTEICKEHGEPLDVMMVACVAFRAGMRAQRKFDHPDKITSVDVGTSAADSRAAIT